MELKCYRCSSWPCTCKDGQTIIHGDCREVLPLLEPVDLVLTDPPYGLNEKWGNGKLGWESCSGRLWNGTPEWDKTTCEDGVERAMSMAQWQIVFGGNYYMMMPATCWLVWDKCQKHTGAEAELAWTNLKKPVRCFRMSRVEAYCGNEHKSHPTQKPLPLMRWCIEQAPPDVVTVLDPFLGSGTTLRACKDLGRRGIGIEIEERYCEIAANRLRQEVLF